MYNLGVTINYIVEYQNECPEDKTIDKIFRPLGHWFVFKLEQGNEMKEFHHQIFISLLSYAKYPDLKNLIYQQIPMQIIKNIHFEHYKESDDVIRGIKYIFKEDTQKGPLIVSNRNCPLVSNGYPMQLSSILGTFDDDSDDEVEIV